jgi:hypothetical protein
MMDADPTEPEPQRSSADDSKGLVVKATRRGSLVVETENARRMMRRFAKVRARDPKAAAARP